MKKVTRLALIGAICAVLPACSSSITRFDYPVMDMNGGPVEKKSAQDYSKSDYSKSDYSRSSYKASDYSDNSYQNNSYNQNRYNSQNYKRPADRYSSSDYSARRPVNDRYSANRYQSNRYNDRRDVYDTASTDRKSQPYKRYADGGDYADGKDDYGRKRLPELNQRRDDYQPRQQSYRQPAPRRDASGHHIVGDGDTLYNISRKYGVEVSRIRNANNLYGNDIKLGQRLIIPGLTKSSALKKAPAKAPLRTRYVVAQGDTAYSIARRYGVTTGELAEANNLSDLTRLREGQHLVIPNKGDQQGAVRVASIDEKIGLNKVTSVKQPARKPIKRANKIKPVKSGVSSQLAGHGKFVWPARGRILSNFGRQKSGTINDGVNLALPVGSNIKAAGDGVVAYSGSELKGYGKLILVRHKNNWVTAYAHNSELMVKRGDKVRRGQLIAKSGKSGSVLQPQLHFELRRGSKPVNPMKHLASR